MKIAVRLWLIYSASPIQKSRSNRAESRVVDIHSGYEELSEGLVQGIHVDGVVFTGQSWINGLLIESILGV